MDVRRITEGGVWSLSLVVCHRNFRQHGPIDAFEAVVGAEVAGAGVPLRPGHSRMARE